VVVLDQDQDALQHRVQRRAAFLTYLTLSTGTYLRHILKSHMLAQVALQGNQYTFHGEMDARCDLRVGRGADFFVSVPSLLVSQFWLDKHVKKNTPIQSPLGYWAELQCIIR
jgi:hypothetical protein